MSIVDEIESIVDEHNCCRFNIQIEQSFVTIIDNRTSDEIVEVDGTDKHEAIIMAIKEFRALSPHKKI
jgi:hypothetical protein